MKYKISVYLFAIIFFANIKIFAEEGMWTFDNLPLQQIKEKYGFEPSKEWLDHIRLSSVRFGNGGSGSFISANGLVITNHHVGVDQLQKMSTPEHDYVTTGFYAKELKDEIKCPDLELNVLINMENVTERMKKAIPEGTDDKEALKLKNEEIRKIESEYTKKNQLKTDVISLYNGGEYWVYQYKKYRDIRLVFAPERQVAYYGGDNDNFTYPRHDLDICFFRIYEDGKPIKCDNFLKWNSDGPKADELVFISGHPGRTDRLKTLAQLQFNRDIALPMRLENINNQLDALSKYAQKGPEEARRALTHQFGLENSKKSILGQLKGLKNPDLMSIKENEEKDFIDRINTNFDWKAKYIPLFDEIKTLQFGNKTRTFKRTFRSFNSTLLGYAMNIVRYAIESSKPEAERLPGYSNEALNFQKFRILTTAPVYKDLDKELAWYGIKQGTSRLGVEDDYWRIIFEGYDPKEVLNKLIDGTHLDNQQFRRSLIEGGFEAVNKSDDPLIQLAFKLDKFSRDEEQEYKDNFESSMNRAMEKLAEARFAVYGHSKYPDANFTLRLTYGTVKGYPMNGTITPPFTTLYGLYDRALGFGRKGDFELPKRFWERQKQLDLSTPVDFVSTCDIIGGNSGSPSVNKSGEFVGIVFDGNIESLAGNFVYDITNNRAVNVDSKYIIEALNKLYDAQKLTKEILGK